jgi:oxepin-CoA hydrolase/3-oxo-5,6-dehydrosuberyl-CoA semialdehyde dehydrogenase
VQPGDEEFDLFVKEVAREMTVKAGQKCTAIRPRDRAAPAPRRGRREAARAAVAVVFGDPAVEGVKMGALASRAQQADVGERLALLAEGNEIVFGAADGFAPKGEGVAGGAFFAPTLILCRDGMRNDAVHDVEAFGRSRR